MIISSPSPPGTPGSLIDWDRAPIQVPFELPQGMEVGAEAPHCHGQMRLATGADELAAQRAAQLLEHDAYGILVRLARVVSFADYPNLSPDDMGDLFMPDITYLIDLYNDLNPPDYGLSLLGEPQAIPWHSFTRR